MTTEATMIIGVIGGICGFAGIFISLICVAMVSGFLRSTHTVQYVPHAVDDTEIPEEVVEDNDEALFNKVGRKTKKPEAPTVLEDLDAPIKEINQSDFLMK